MADSHRAVRSLFMLGRGRRTIYVLPLRAVAYGVVSLAIVVMTAVLFDRVLLDWLERRGWIAGRQWARHNAIVEENHRRKTTTSDCEPRHWNGQPLPTNNGRQKILVLGDSFVWGPPYVTLNHLWWRQLQIELQRRGYHDVDVLAVGKAGWSTHMQLDCARQLIPQLKPDVVIWGYVTNDPDEKLVRQINDTAERLPYGERARRLLKQILPNLEFKFEALRSEKLSAQYTGPIYGYAYSDWELKLLEGENFTRYRETIDQMAALIRESKVPAFLMTLPHFPSREYFEPRYAPVLKEWKAAGVTVLDTLDEFVRRYGDVPPAGPETIRWGINPADSHPGPTATHFYATQAADYLEKLWPELLGPKNTKQSHELVINDWLPSDLNVRHSPTGILELDYPTTTDHMLQLPAPPAALVALRYPTPISSVVVGGPDMKRARIWALFQPEEQLNDDAWHELRPFREESGEFWMPPEFIRRPVSAFRFTAEIHGPNRHFQFMINPADMRAAIGSQRVQPTDSPSN